MSFQPGEPAQPSLLLVAHGIAGGPGRAGELATLLEHTGRFGAVALGCHKGEPDLLAALDELPAGPVLAAPLLMAQGWIHAAVRRRLKASARAAEISLAPALGTHPALWRLVLTRASGLCAARGWTPAGTTLLLAAHGTARHRGAAASARAVGERIRAQGTFRHVRLGFLDEAPRLEEAAAGLDRGPAVTVGFFVDNGPHGRDDVNEALAVAPGPVAYTGAIGADATVLPYLLDQLGAAEPLLAPPARRREAPVALAPHRLG